MHRIVLAFVVLTLAASCGDGDASGNGTKSLSPNGQGDGKPAMAVAVVTPSTTGSGESTTVDCIMQDSGGNKLPEYEFTINVEPPEGVLLAGVQATGNVPGDYNVLCQFVDMPNLPQQHLPSWRTGHGPWRYGHGTGRPV